MRHLLLSFLLGTAGLGLMACSTQPLPDTDTTAAATATLSQTATDRVVVSGFACDNGYGGDLNQEYAYQGTTKDGRPYYRGTTRTDRYIYYDKHCAADTPGPRWLLGGKPVPGRSWNLNPYDTGCENDFSIRTDRLLVLLDLVLSGPQGDLPIGTQETDWLWCGDHGLTDRTITITRVEETQRAD